MCAIPASSFAGVFISVGFAPPVLPVYVQPLCPEPGLMWTPGYWGYGPDGYYWVPGTWVPAPYVGALWTPGYWGFEAGLYGWHAGYWGPHVGYYGGVNYGFGYGGIGFAGGMWRGGVFAYNTAVMHVGVGGVWGGRVYEDRVAVDRGFVARDSHVAYSGGPGGINHRPTPEENAYSHEQHTAPTAMQSQHEGAARGNTNNYASHNGGHPTNLATDTAGGRQYEQVRQLQRLEVKYGQRDDAPRPERKHGQCAEDLQRLALKYEQCSGAHGRRAAARTVGYGRQGPGAGKFSRSFAWQASSLRSGSTKNSRTEKARGEPWAFLCCQSRSRISGVIFPGWGRSSLRGCKRSDRSFRS